MTRQRRRPAPRRRSPEQFAALRAERAAPGRLRRLRAARPADPSRRGLALHRSARGARRGARRSRRRPTRRASRRRARSLAALPRLGGDAARAGRRPLCAGLVRRRAGGADASPTSPTRRRSRRRRRRAQRRLRRRRAAHRPGVAARRIAGDRASRRRRRARSIRALDVFVAGARARTIVERFEGAGGGDAAQRRRGPRPRRGRALRLDDAGRRRRRAASRDASASQARAATRSFTISASSAAARSCGGRLDVGHRRRRARTSRSAACRCSTATRHADTTLVVDHAAPHGVSREYFRHIVADEATGVYQGKVIVAPARAEDRRRHEVAGAAALADRGDEQQAGARNLRRRRRLRPWRHRRRARSRADVLSARARPAAAPRPRRCCWRRSAPRRSSASRTRPSPEAHGASALAAGRAEGASGGVTLRRRARCAPISRSWPSAPTASRSSISTTPPRRRSRRR